MSMKSIREKYGVPAYRGGRVEYTGSGSNLCGTIKSANGSYLSIQLDEEKRPGLFHPTWSLLFLKK